MSRLYIVGTPIGNLEDISLRALRTLKEVDVVLCEDTRVTKRLLEYYDIKTPTLSYHQHSKLERVERILEMLGEGKNLALVSDAGTPGISDPGNKLVKEVLGKLPDVEIVPIAGPSALTAASSIAGFSMDKFLFFGFPPQKNKRKKYFSQLVSFEYPVVFYESSHRIKKTLKEIEETDPTARIVVCRELTKKFETIYRGTVEEVMERIRDSETRGEFVVVVQK